MSFWKILGLILILLALPSLISWVQNPVNVPMHAVIMVAIGAYLLLKDVGKRQTTVGDDYVKAALAAAAGAGVVLGIKKLLEGSGSRGSQGAPPSQDVDLGELKRKVEEAYTSGKITGEQYRMLMDIIEKKRGAS